MELESRRCTCRNEKRVRKILVQYSFLLAKIHLVQVVFIVTGPAANIAMRFSKIARAEKKKSQCSSDYDK